MRRLPRCTSPCPLLSALDSCQLRARPRGQFAAQGVAPTARPRETKTRSSLCRQGLGGSGLLVLLVSVQRTRGRVEGQQVSQHAPSVRWVEGLLGQAVRREAVLNVIPFSDGPLRGLPQGLHNRVRRGTEVLVTAAGTLPVSFSSGGVEATPEVSTGHGSRLPWAT